MVDFQQAIYFVTLLLASLTAILGIIIVNNLFKKKLKGFFDNTTVLIFSLFALGYGCFALAEIGWFLIFKVFKELPIVSMPDFYWVVGSLCLFIGFLTFAVYAYKRTEKNKLILLSVLGIVILGMVLYYTQSLNLSGAEKKFGSLFLGYYYPIMSTLILLASMGVYLFLENNNSFRNDLLLLFLANVAFLLGDLFYTYYATKNVYGLVGAASDFLYVGAYLLCSISFLSLLRKIE